MHGQLWVPRNHGSGGDAGGILGTAVPLRSEAE